MTQKTFKSSYFFRLLERDFNPFTGFTINVCSDYLEIKQRNWYLISVDTSNIYFKNLIGADVDKHLFGADIVFRLKGDNNFIVYGFSKATADNIKNVIKAHIAEIDKRNSNKVLDGVKQTIQSNTSTGKISVTQELRELKNLLDDGVITKDEFIEQKAIILNQD